MYGGGLSIVDDEVIYGECEVLQRNCDAETVKFVGCCVYTNVCSCIAFMRYFCTFSMFLLLFLVHNCVYTSVFWKKKI